MVHVTAMLGFAHAYFVLGLRHAEGWIGYGTHIESARYGRLATIGPPLLLECRATQARRIRGSIYVRYAIRFEQEGGASGKRDAYRIVTAFQGYDILGIPPQGDKIMRAKPFACFRMIVLTESREFDEFGARE